MDREVDMRNRTCASPIDAAPWLILQYYVNHRDDLGPAEIPPARALLAVRRSAGAADRRGARGTRSRSARSALRRRGRARFRSPSCFRRSTAQIFTAHWSWQGSRPSSAKPGAAPRTAIAHASGRAMPRGCAICSRSSADPMRPTCSSTIGPFLTRASCGCRSIWFLIPR